MRRPLRGTFVALLVSAVSAASAWAHDVDAVQEISAKKLVVIDKTQSSGTSKTLFLSKDRAILKGTGLDVGDISLRLEVSYAGAAGSTAGAFVVPAGAGTDRSGWKTNRATLAKYLNKDAPSGPTTTKVALVKPGKVAKLVAKGVGDLPLDVLRAGAPQGDGVHTTLEVTNGSETHRHCSLFPTERCKWKTIAKGAGAKLVCKKGEGGACAAAPTCAADVSGSTFDAIQSVVFDSPVYACTNVACHSGPNPQGGLDLTAGNSYDALVGVPSETSPGYDRVEPGEPDFSVLFDKLHAGTTGVSPSFGGSSMPVGPTPLTAAHLEAVKKWIRGGAPRDLVVAGTGALLATCLGDPDPLVIPPPDPPAPGLGVQLRQPPWALPPNDEGEICTVTHYDFSATDLVPDDVKISCEIGAANNPSGECFTWNAQQLAQDPQSHHSIIHIYTGASDWTDPSWGAWTRKLQDASDPDHGTPCDPTDVDPATGRAANCSGAVIPSIACIGYGPADNRASFTGGFSGSQEPFYRQEFAPGAYSVLPMAGYIIWNSHAFNTTNAPGTLSQYLNLEFAPPEGQLFPVQQIFDASSIFIMDVPPFTSREYCADYVIPRNSNLFQLSSHTHRHGVHFRIFGPPNANCAPGEIGQGGCQPGPPAQLAYESFEYTDPVQLSFAPPWAFGDVAADERRFIFCSRYDNGETPESPAVKTNSDPLGGCGIAVRRCLDGAKRGEACNGVDATCDSTPGAGDGRCDACPVRGGVTTEDEMFIMLGLYY